MVSHHDSQLQQEKFSWCADGDEDDWVWTLQLKLADATDQLDALLFHGDGTHFLQVCVY